MAILPHDEVSDWLYVDRKLAGVLARPDEFSPDVVLVSATVADIGLRDLAALLGLQPSTQRPMVGRRWPAPIRTPPFTYVTGSLVDPRQWFVFSRQYGETLDVQGQIVSGTATLRFPCPVGSIGGGHTLLRIHSPAFDGLPQRPSVAGQIAPNAAWRAGGIQFAVDLQSEYRFDIRIPVLDDTLAVLLSAATAKYALSDKGRLAVGLTATTGPEALLPPGVYEAIVALTTPRSKSMIRELKGMRATGADDDGLLALAQRWGGRVQRRYRAASELKSNLGNPATVLERLCDLGWAERGLEINCGRCGFRSFVRMTEVDGAATCPGCKNRQSYTVGQPGPTVYYRLDTFLDRLSDQGVLPHLLTVAALTRRDPVARILPGIDVWFTDGHKTEIDIVGIHDGKLLAGEVKTAPQEFDEAQINRDIANSQRLGVDIHLMATVDDVPASTAAFAHEAAKRAGLMLTIFSRADLRPP